MLLVTAAAQAVRTSTVGARPVPKLGQTVVVDARGHTLYALSGETAKRLKCTSTACLAIWPPLTVSRTATPRVGKAVRGRLGTVRRADGRLQVTLRGRPLYRFAGDRMPDDANGQGMTSAGGTWQAVLAAGGTVTTPGAVALPGYPFPL